jgi:hypothetical protein
MTTTTRPKKLIRIKRDRRVPSQRMDTIWMRKAIPTRNMAEITRVGNTMTLVDLLVAWLSVQGVGESRLLLGSPSRDLLASGPGVYSFAFSEAFGRDTMA